MITDPRQSVGELEYMDQWIFINVYTYVNLWGSLYTAVGYIYIYLSYINDEEKDIYIYVLYIKLYVLLYIYIYISYYTIVLVGFIPPSFVDSITICNHGPNVCPRFLHFFSYFIP